MGDPRSQIENTLYRYAWAYDMDELEAMGGCFTAHARVEFRDTGLIVGRDAVVTEMRRRREKYDDGSTPWHVITNVYITDETADQARVRSWFTFFVQAPDGAQRFVNIGWYDDLFVNEDTAWRIQRRRILSPHER
jgi:hypothetical protein